MTTIRPIVPEHRAFVRVTHWINLLSFVALVVSGIAILMAHPRFYWGDVGNDEMAAAFQAPVPLNLKHSGWGRSVHFLAAWITVLNGLAYVATGLAARHFRRRMGLGSEAASADPSYGVVQKLAYLTIVFGVLPASILTGLTLSPAMTAAFPWLPVVFGGRQSARTLHYFVALSLLLFLAIHVVQVIRAGWSSQIRAMTVGARTR